MLKILGLSVLLLGAGCSAVPSESFRSAPWQGEIQGALLQRTCELPADDGGLCRRLLLKVADVVAGRSASGFTLRTVGAGNPELVRRLIGVRLGNHLEVHLHVPGGTVEMRDFEDHGAAPSSWQAAILQASLELATGAAGEGER